MTKVKMKTKKALKGRFRATASGKLKLSHSGRRHILTKKTSKRKRQMRKPGVLTETLTKKYTKMMGV